MTETTDPPVDPPKLSYELLEQKARHFEAELTRVLANQAIRDKADAEALARELDENNPDRDYQNIYTACCAVGLDSPSDHKKVWKWSDQGKIYSRKPDGIHIEVCVNDLRDKVNKTGRHR